MKDFVRTIVYESMSCECSQPYSSVPSKSACSSPSSSSSDEGTGAPLRCVRVFTTCFTTVVVSLMIALVPKAMLENYLAVFELSMLSRLRFCLWAVDLRTVGKELNTIVISIYIVIRVTIQ